MAYVIPTEYTLNHERNLDGNAKLSNNTFHADYMAPENMIHVKSMFGRRFLRVLNLSQYHSTSRSCSAGYDDVKTIPDPTNFEPVYTTIAIDNIVSMRLELPDNKYDDFKLYINDVVVLKITLLSYNELWAETTKPFENFSTVLMKYVLRELGIIEERDDDNTHMDPENMVHIKTVYDKEFLCILNPVQTPPRSSTRYTDLPIYTLIATDSINSTRLALRPAPGTCTVFTHKVYINDMVFEAEISPKYNLWSESIDGLDIPGLIIRRLIRMLGIIDDL